jgi:hypothetical protein
MKILTIASIILSSSPAFAGTIVGYVDLPEVELHDSPYVSDFATDILGLKLGMRPDTVFNILKQNGCTEIKGETYRSQTRIDKNDVVVEVKGEEDDSIKSSLSCSFEKTDRSEKYYVHFTSYYSGNQAHVIERTVRYNRSAKAPILGDTVDAIYDKYGEPNVENGQGITWNWEKQEETKSKHHRTLRVSILRGEGAYINDRFEETVDTIYFTAKDDIALAKDKTTLSAIKDKVRAKWEELSKDIPREVRPVPKL